jgi:rubrerythrin
MRKVITKPTDLGFSVMAVTCPSCGASFDAEKVKNCPSCGNAYPLEENEWVVTDIRI